MLNTQQQKIISIPINNSTNTPTNISIIDTNGKIKKIGTREMVYKGLALRTSGNLTKNDIEYKIINGKEWYISKKMSERMRELIKKNAFSRRKKTHVNTYALSNTTNNISANNISTNNISTNSNIINNQKITSPENINPLINQTCKTIKNIKFAHEKNNIHEVFYNELSDYDIAELRAEAELEDTMSAPKPFIVESVDDIDLDQRLLQL